jgi:ankyrin repeat protein
VKLLIEQGANINLKNSFGATPLCLAALRNSSDIVELLLKAGASATSENNSGETPFTCCCFR